MNCLIVLVALSLFVVCCECMEDSSRAILLSKFISMYANEISKRHEVHPFIKFDDDYSNKKMPLKSLPLDLNLTINIKNIYGVDEVNQLLGLETTVQMNWIDHRVTLLNVSKEHVNLDRITLPSEEAINFWVPDLFIDGAKEIDSPTYYHKPAYIRVYKNHLIRYSGRIQFAVSCHMDFHFYPNDEQTCNIKFESFGYTKEYIRFNWHKISSFISPELSMTQFKMKADFAPPYSTDTYDLEYPGKHYGYLCKSKLKYQGITLRIYLHRNVTYHLFATYLPSALVVMIAWLGLFISPSQTEARVGMNLTSLLTLIAMFDGIRAEVPKVSYITFMDIWITVCVVIIFLAIAEYAVTHSLTRHKLKRKAIQIDRVSRLVMMALFIAFNVTYWPLLLKKCTFCEIDNQRHFNSTSKFKVF